MAPIQVTLEKLYTTSSKRAVKRNNLPKGNVQFDSGYLLRSSCQNLIMGGRPHARHGENGDVYRTLMGNKIGIVKKTCHL